MRAGIGQVSLFSYSLRSLKIYAHDPDSATPRSSAALRPPSFDSRPRHKIQLAPIRMYWGVTVFAEAGYRKTEARSRFVESLPSPGRKFLMNNERIVRK